MPYGTIHGSSRYPFGMFVPTGDVGLPNKGTHKIKSIVQEWKKQKKPPKVLQSFQKYAKVFKSNPNYAKNNKINENK